MRYQGPRQTFQLDLITEGICLSAEQKHKETIVIAHFCANSHRESRRVMQPV